MLFLFFRFRPLVRFGQPTHFSILGKAELKAEHKGGLNYRLLYVVNLPCGFARPVFPTRQPCCAIPICLVAPTTQVQKCPNARADERKTDGHAVELAIFLRSSDDEALGRVPNQVNAQIARRSLLFSTCSILFSFIFLSLQLSPAQLRD